MCQHCLQESLQSLFSLIIFIMSFLFFLGLYFNNAFMCILMKTINLFWTQIDIHNVFKAVCQTNFNISGIIFFSGINKFKVFWGSMPDPNWHEILCIWCKAISLVAKDYKLWRLNRPWAKFWKISYSCYIFIRFSIQILRIQINRQDKINFILFDFNWKVQKGIKNHW